MRHPFVSARFATAAVSLAVALVLGRGSPVSAQTAISVSNETELRNAIFQVSNDLVVDGVANGGPYTITLTGNITLTQSLPMLRAETPGGGAVAVTINGAGFAVDANNTGRVFFIESGTVSITDVSVNNAAARGGDGGDGALNGGGGGGGLGAGGAVFVNQGANVTLSGVTVGNATAVGGAGGAVSGAPGNNGGGGGGGLGGAGGAATNVGGGGGGGYAGAGGTAGPAGSGGGGEFGRGGTADGGGGGGGGQQGNGGAGGAILGGSAGGGGGGGGATTDGSPAVIDTGGVGGGAQGGAGGDDLNAGATGAALGGGGGGGNDSAGGGDGPGGAGGASGGGGGGGFGSTGNAGGNGGVGGGGGGSTGGNGGLGGAFGGGGGTGGSNNVAGGAGGFGGGGGGAHIGQVAGNGGFGGGGGGAQGGAGAGGTFGGNGGNFSGGPSRPAGGGGAALGGAVFVRDGGSLTIVDGGFTGTYGVTAGAAGGPGATGGQALGTTMFLHGTGATTLDITTGNTQTIAGTGAVAGTGALNKSGAGTLVVSGGNANYSGAAAISGGIVAMAAGNSLGTGAVTLNGGTMRSNAAISVANALTLGASNGTWDTNGNATTLSGNIGGAGALTKTGTGTLTLSGTNNYAGGTTVSAGTLQGNTTSLQGNITNDAAVTFTQATTGSYSGNMVGTGSLTKSGAGALTLMGTNGYTGGTTVAAGTLVQGAAGAFAGNTAYTINGGTLDLNDINLTASALSGAGGIIDLGAATLTANQSTNTAFAGVVSGAGGLNKTGAGALTLSGANAYTGGTTVAAGTLVQGAAGAFAGNTAYTINGGTLDLNDINLTASALSGAGGIIDLGAATLTANQSTNTAFAGVVSGAGGLNKAGAGTLTLSGANAYTGGTTVAAGTLVQGVAGGLTANTALAVNGGTLDLNDFGFTASALSGAAGTIDLGTAALGVNQTASTTFGGSLTGAGGLTKGGTGTLILTGDAAHTGGTTVTAGLLQLGTTAITSATLAGDVNVQSGGALGGTGTISGVVTVGAGARLAPGASIGTLTTGTLALDASSTLEFEFAAPGISDRVVVNGNLTLDGTLNVIDAGGFGAGVYRLFDYSGLFTNNGLTIGTTPTGVSASLLTIQTSVAKQVNLIRAGNDTLTFWDGAGSSANGVINGGNGVWSASAANWTDSTGAAAGAASSRAFVVFQGTPGTITVDTGAGAITPAGMQFAVDGYHVVGGAITLDSPLTAIRVGDGTSAGVGMVATIASPLIGSGGVLKTDFGTLVLSGASSYTGATQVDSGTLRLGSSTALGRTSGLFLGGNATLDLGGFALGLGAIAGTGRVALGGGALTLGVGDMSSTFAGLLTGHGTFAKTGAGTLTLASANQHTGATRVEGGTLTAGAANAFSAGSAVTVATGATLDLNGFSQSVGSLSGDGTVALGSATMVAGVDGATTTFGGRITGRGGIVKAGTGTWTLAGANDYTGTTVISAGTLRAGGGRALGSTSGVVVNADGTLDLNGFDHAFGIIGGTGRVELGVAQLTLGVGDLSAAFAGTLTGAGSLKKTGAGTLGLFGPQRYTGGTLVESGMLLGDATSLQGAIVNDGAVAFEQTANGTFAGRMSGRGGLLKQGTGMLTLGGVNTYTGGTLITAGTLAGSTESLQGTVVTNAALRLDQSFSGIFSGTIMGSGTFTKAGSGVVSLIGSHPISGPTTVESGTLVLNGAVGGSVQVQPGATFLAQGAINGALTIGRMATAGAVAGPEALALDAPQAAGSPDVSARWMTAAADVQASVGALGQLAVAGDVTLHQGSTYQTAIDPNGASTLLSSGGTARIGGTTLVLETGGGEYPRVMQTALITAAGGVLGIPDIRTGQPALETIITNDGQRLFLTVLNSAAPLAAGVTTINAAAMAGALDRLRSQASGDLAAVTRELAALSDAELNGALDGMATDLHATAVQLSALDAEAGADQIRAQVFYRRQPHYASAETTAGVAGASAQTPSRWGAGRRWWGNIGGQRATFDATAEAHGGRGHLGGFALGVDWAPRAAWLLGAGGGYSIGALDFSGVDGEVTATAPRAYGYAGYGRGSWTLQTGVSLGRTTYQTERAFAFEARLDPRLGSRALFGGVDRRAESESAGIDTGVWFDARLDLSGAGWIVQPTAGLRTASVGRAAWSETGADALSLAALDQTLRSTQADFGVRLARAGGRIRPVGSAMYRRELGNGLTTTTLQLSSATTGRFTVQGVPFAVDRLIATVGVMSNAWSFGYRVDSGGGQFRHGIDVGVRLW